MNRQATAETQRSDTHAAALRTSQSPVRGILNRLMRIAPPPLDCGGLLSFCVGAATLLSVAERLLKQPTAEFLLLHDECRALAATCIDRFEASGQADAEGALSDYRRAHPAWAAIVCAGQRDDLEQNAAAAALAVELCVSLAQHKGIAVAFASDARNAMSHDDWHCVGLHDAIELEWEGRPPHWVTHGKKALIAFRGHFETAPAEPPKPKSFEERAAAELRNRAAFTNYRRRAGITDKTCLSRTQIQESIDYGSPAPFSSLLERKAAIWFLGMSGLFPKTVHEIPLSAHAPSTWAMHYDPIAGHLHRDYSSLAKQSAKLRTGNFVPTSYCSVTPAPEEVREFTSTRASVITDPATVGDLIPALRQIQSHGLMYPWAGELGPSWARWARSTGPCCLQLGIDSLLGGLITGDLGTTARSKLSYCEVTHDEIKSAATRLYAALGFGNPVPFSREVPLAFGSTLTTPIDELAALDAKWVSSMDVLRPPNRTTSTAAIERFHNKYVRIMGARAKLWLSLRAAHSLPVRATLDADADLVTDLLEKASAGRVGGMPSVICNAMRRDLLSYLAHCKALRERLRGFGWRGNVIEWLDAVIDGEDVPLLCEIANGQARPIGTRHVLELEGASELAPDFGRKAAENYLRRAGARWQDIDRHQRHEVQGQEQDVQVAEGTEADWARRLAPLLDQLSAQVHTVPLHGLRTIKERK